MHIKNLKEKLTLLFVPILMISLQGCTINRSIIPIHYLKHPVTISYLRKNSSSFLLFYSGPPYNPSAILFLKKGVEGEIYLSNKWKPIKKKERLRDLLDRINYLNPSLQGIIIPSSGMLVGYLYTPGTTYLIPQGKNRYFLLGIDEIFNDIYYDEQWPFEQYQTN